MATLGRGLQRASSSPQCLLLPHAAGTDTSPWPHQGPRHPQNCSKTPPQPLSLQSRARARADPSAPTLPPLSSTLRAAWRAFPCPAPRSQTGGMLQGGALEPALLFAVPHFAVLQLLSRPGSPAGSCSLSLLAQPPRTLRTACPAPSSRRHLALLSAPHRAQIGPLLPKTGSPCAPQEQGSQPQRGRPLSKVPALSQAAGAPRGAALTLVGSWPPGPWCVGDREHSASSQPARAQKRPHGGGGGRELPTEVLAVLGSLLAPCAAHLAGGAQEAAVSLPRQALQLVPVRFQCWGRKARSGPPEGLGTLSVLRRTKQDVPTPALGTQGRRAGLARFPSRSSPRHHAARWFSTRAAWCCQMTPFCSRKQVSLPQVTVCLPHGDREAVAGSSGLKATEFKTQTKVVPACCHQRQASSALAAQWPTAPTSPNFLPASGCCCPTSQTVTRFPAPLARTPSAVGWNCSTSTGPPLGPNVSPALLGRSWPLSGRRQTFTCSPQKMWVRPRVDELALHPAQSQQRVLAALPGCGASYPEPGKWATRRASSRDPWWDRGCRHPG